MRQASVVVGSLTGSIDGVFGYTVAVTNPAGDTTELERHTGRVLEWNKLKAKAEERARFFAEAFGARLFV